MRPIRYGAQWTPEEDAELKTMVDEALGSGRKLWLRKMAKHFHRSKGGMYQHIARHHPQALPVLVTSRRTPTRSAPKRERQPVKSHEGMIRLDIPGKVGKRRFFATEELDLLAQADQEGVTPEEFYLRYQAKMGPGRSINSILDLWGHRTRVLKAYREKMKTTTTQAPLLEPEAVFQADPDWNEKVLGILESINTALNTIANTLTAQGETLKATHQLFQELKQKNHQSDQT